MENCSDKVVTTTLVAMILFVMSFIGGCGESEAGRAVTDLVKMVVGGEVAKQGNEVKKQIDQIMNLGSDKGTKEGEGGTKEESEKGSGTESTDGASENED